MAKCRDLKSLSKKEFQEFFNSFDVVLSDCDGVLWKEKNAIEGSPETVKKCIQLGKKFFYVTNNNCQTRAELVKKCKRLQYDTTEEDVLCSSYLAAEYLRQKHLKKKAYVIGNEGLIKELEAVGIDHCGIGPDVQIDENELETLLNFKKDPEVGAVVVGFDKHFSYPKLIKAATYAHDPDVHFIGTNPDVERPSPNENRFPETGCFLVAIEAIAGRKAVVLGKPEWFVIEVIKQKYGINPSRTLMIGDNLATDILLGERAGFTTLLVMTGVSTPELLTKLKQNPDGLPLPNFCANRLSDILDCINSRP